VPVRPSSVLEEEAMTQLTHSTSYAIRGLKRLVAANRSLHIEQIAHAERLSPTFMAKVFQALARAGVVKTKRGRGGGVELARAAGQITLLEVIEAMEGPVSNLFYLLDHGFDCSAGRRCEVHEIWTVVQRATSEILRQTSLAQLFGDGYAAVGAAAGEPPAG